MKRLSLKKKLIAGAAVAALVVGASGAAYAYFTSSGAGTGSATVGTTSDLTIAQDAFGNTPPQQPAVTLYPGAGVQGINFTITNPGGGHEFVNQVTASIPSSGGDVLDATSLTHDPIVGCHASWFQLNNAVQTVGQDIPGSGATYDYTSGNLSIQLNDDATNSQDACKLANVQVNFTSN
jgi:hypothetical protein